MLTGQLYSSPATLVTSLASLSVLSLFDHVVLRWPYQRAAGDTEYAGDDDRVACLFLVML